ncbi:MAG: DUF4142 domain-containing protein [Chitinophagaceae bacterium]|nr:MAG: DUF4142 domain-containing protein [Chitinophagaceae bacterium]
MKVLFVAAMAAGVLLSCNDRDSSQQTATVTDSSNLVNAHPGMEGGNSPSQPATADSVSSNFLMKAADGGLAEVMAGQQAQGKAVNESVKMFAGMMVNDHTGANGTVKQLAEERQLALPAAPSAEQQRAIDAVAQKSGAAFDKAYMDMMVKDHKKTISLFREAGGSTNDQPVKAFINETLPRLQVHLDSAVAIQKRL